MNWARILTYVTGSVPQELLAQSEYLTDGNRTAEVSDGERATDEGHDFCRPLLDRCEGQDEKTRP